MVLIFGFVEGVLEPIVRISNQLSSSDLATFLMSQQILPSFSFDYCCFPLAQEGHFFSAGDAQMVEATAGFKEL